MSPLVMPSSGHHTLLTFEIVTPPIVAPSVTRAVPTCTPPASCRRRTLGTPAAAACRSGLDDLTPDRVPSTPTLLLRRALAARARDDQLGCFNRTVGSRLPRTREC